MHATATSTIFGLLILMSLCLTGCSDDEEGMATTFDRPDTVSFLGSTITFADQALGQQLLRSSDEYTQQLGPFDLQSKTQNAVATTETEYLTHAAQQARAWTPEEVTTLQTIITSAEARMNTLGLKLLLPSKMILVRSTMQEEGGAAGYTRQNFIVLGDQLNEYLFLHELFHVYSRANPAQRDALYTTIGFRKTNAITLPEPLATRKISNPDAPVHDHVIEVTINGTSQEAIFLLYADRAYTQGTFFGYLNKRLLLVEGDDTNKQARLENGQPVLRDYDEATDLRDMIGRNTEYDIDPEEVMADHFALLVMGIEVPEPAYLKAAKTILQSD